MFSLDKIKQNKMNKINITKDKKKYFKDYYKKNKERLLQKSKQFYLDNKDEINKNRKGKQNKYLKEYYNNHKDYFKARQQTDKFKEKQKEAQKKSYYKNHELRKAKLREYYHKTKPPPKPKKLISAKSKTYCCRSKNLIMQKPNKSNYIYTDDGCIILRF